MNRIEVTDEQIHAAQAGDSDAMWAIVQRVDPMLKSIIRSTIPAASTEDAEDYLQEARAVLIQHVRDYDSSSSAAQLTSYVYRAVRRAVMEADIMTKSPLTLDPTAAIRVRRALWECGGDMEKAWATFRDAASPTKRMTRELFIAMVEALAGTESLDAPANTGSGQETHETLTLADVIADKDATVTDPLERRDLARWLMTQIPQRQSLALRAFFGVGMERRPDQDVCADLEVNGAALRRLRSRGTSSARYVAEAHDLAA
ncbi:sigma factor [Streptomyces sp. NPDC005302]|uniref:sigma factor n=1 Tax=Streptomyces sp. NPDC005302 TaxID=3154675 RepID=UPI0033B2641E